MNLAITHRKSVHKNVLMHANNRLKIYSNVDRLKLLCRRLFPVKKLIFIYSILMCSSILNSTVFAEELRGNNSTMFVYDPHNLVNTKRVINSPQKRVISINQDASPNLSATSNVTQNRPQFVSSISKDSLHESPAPSTLSSIYDYINNRRQQQQQQEIKLPATRTLPTNGIPSFQQFDINDIRQPQNYDHQKPVALGRENDSLLKSSHKKAPSSQLDELSEIFQPFLVTANGNSLKSSDHNHLLSSKQHSFSRPIALQSNEEHVLSGHYLHNNPHLHVNNNIDVHHPLPQVISLAPVQNNQHRQHVHPRNANPHVYKSVSHFQGKDTHEADKNPYKQQAGQSFYQTSSPRKPLDFLQKEAEYKENLNKRRFSPLLKEQRVLPDEIKGKIYPDTTRLNERQKLLSDEQLVSLIDELKEFNSRQASKMRSGGFVPPMALARSSKVDMEKRIIDKKGKRKLGSTSSHKGKGRDNEPDYESNSNETEDSPDDTEGNGNKISKRKTENNTRNPNRTNNMSTDDLAKFAKFLMSKEGSNLKFQLGLDKETIDDGDFDDEKDALLESNEKQTKAEPKRMPSRGTETLDRKYKEVATNMDKMYDRLGNRAKYVDKELGRRQMIEKLKKRRRLEEIKSNKMEARNRRDRDETNTSNDSEPSNEQRQELSINGQERSQEDDNAVVRSDPKEANFAKLLIKQEILEDQRESAQDPPTYSSNTVEKSDADDDEQGRNQGKNSKTLIDVNAESSLPKAQTEYGEEEDQYPVNERTHDHSDLLNNLQKARKTKSKTRSRIPMPVDSLLKRALDGDLGLRTEKRSDGKLLLRDTTRGNVAILDLPNKNGESEVEQTTKSTEDDGSLNSELVPSHQTNPNLHVGTQGSSNVLVQSSKPVKDEYPISERVSAGLNKLSNNLDRYFNDGFLAEIESKSREGVIKNNRNDHQPKNKESHQPESSNVNEAARQVVVDEIQKGTDRKLEDEPKDEVEKKIKGKVDHDFDVDVGIDGKKDNDREDDETDRSDDLDRDDDNEKSNSKRKKVKLLRKKKIKVNNELKRGDSFTKGNENFNSNSNNKIRKVKEKTAKETNKKNPKVGKEPPITDDNHGTRSVSRDMTTRSEKVEFENLGRIAPNLDPVESENLETPIGPDPDTGVEADILSKQKTKSTKGTEVSASYGKKVPGKFYEEPEWR